MHNRTRVGSGSGRATSDGVRALLRGIPEAARSLVPAELRGFQAKISHSMLQCWYGNRSLHFEVWSRPRLGVVELGLHFEADPLTNERLLGAMRASHAAIRRGLGPAARLEEWDRGWTRVWEPIAADGPGLGHHLATRLARYVTTLEPLLVDALPADIAWREP